MSTDAIHRCGICRCYLDNEDLFCGNCGTENAHADSSAKRLANAPTFHNFSCQSCGASMSYDASAQALRCPFCGSTKMERRETARSVKPHSVVPRVISQQQAEATLREWLGRGFWRPKDAARASHIGKMTAVYVPYWVFEAKTDTHWTADSSPAPPGSRGDWYPVSGRNRSQYPGILIGGSSVLTSRETQAIAPFRLEAAQALDALDLTNEIVEEFRVPRKLARPLARSTIEELERAACTQHVPNRARKLRVNVRISAMQGSPALLPVWILAYRYKQKLFRVLINGQTGRIAGDAPFSYHKLVVALLILGGIVGFFILLSIIAAAAS